MPETRYAVCIGEWVGRGGGIMILLFSLVKETAFHDEYDKKYRFSFH